MPSACPLTAPLRTWSIVRTGGSHQHARCYEHRMLLSDVLINMSDVMWGLLDIVLQGC